MVLLSDKDGIASLWSGGGTMQLAIGPQGSLYPNRDFDFRISVATIEEEESIFTPLPGYTRRLVPLCDSMHLTNDQKDIVICQNEVYSFDGADVVCSHGKAKDFGVMCRKGVCRSRVEVVTLLQGSVYKGGDAYVYTAQGYTAECVDGLQVISDQAVLIAVHIEYDLKLVVPNERHKAIWQAAMTQFAQWGESPTPYGIHMEQKGFEDFITESMRINGLTNFINEPGKEYPIAPTTTYFLTDYRESEILGTISVRRMLTESLRRCGGNIGYGIMPNMRGKGYGVKMLAMCLEKCREMGLFAVMLTCDERNKASSQIMLRNGAVHYASDLHEDGTPYQRYYILLT